MRDFLKLAIISMAVALLPAQLQAKGEDKNVVYAFGYSTNLNDTTLYLSPVQVLEGATLTKKEGFLEYRNAYGNQLKAYLESIYEGHQTCAVFFSKDKKSIKKKYHKLRAHLLKMKHTHLTELTSNDFKFQPLVVE